MATTVDIPAEQRESLADAVMGLAQPLGVGVSLVKDAPHVLKPYIEGMKSRLLAVEAARDLAQGRELPFIPDKLIARIKELPNTVGRALQYLAEHPKGKLLGTSKEFDPIRWRGNPDVPWAGRYYKEPTNLIELGTVQHGEPAIISNVGHEAGHHATEVLPTAKQAIYEDMRTNPGWELDVWLDALDAAKRGKVGVHNRSWLLNRNEAVARNLQQRFAQEMGITPEILAETSRFGKKSQPYYEFLHHKSYPQPQGREAKDAYDMLYDIMLGGRK